MSRQMVVVFAVAMALSAESSASTVEFAQPGDEGTYAGQLPPVSLLSGSASGTPQFVLAPYGGIKDQYIVLLEKGETPAGSLAEGLASQFSGRVMRVWEHAVRGFLTSMSESAAQALSKNPHVRGVYQDARFPIEDVLANEAPYCYDLPREECVPPGFWIHNGRPFGGMPQEITCADPDPAGQWLHRQLGA